MKFTIFTKIPPERGLLGTIPERVSMEETEAEDINAVIDGLRVPMYGECYVVSEENLIRVKSRLVNEVVKDGR